MEDILTIVSYSDSERKSKLGTFECFVSPMSIKLKRNNNFGTLNVVNGTIPIVGFANGGRNTMEVSILLDGTGAYAYKNNEPIEVIKQLSSLLENTMQYKGSIHQPPFLKVMWGTLPVFLCRAESIDIDYKTFNSEGIPVQANVNLTLIEDVDEELSKKQANKESPDLFHEHIVLEGESLALISYNYYASTSYLKRIANANHLNNLYDIYPGQVLTIPPLK